MFSPPQAKPKVSVLGALPILFAEQAMVLTLNLTQRIALRQKVIHTGDIAVEVKLDHSLGKVYGSYLRLILGTH